MAITITPYNHTANRMQGGLDVATDSYKINLYTVLPFVASATTKAGAEAGATQVATANGYTQNATTLTSVVIQISGTNGSRFAAANVAWAASGGNISAEFGMVYNDTDTDDPPLYHIDFGELFVATPGRNFEITWHPDGIAILGIVS